MFSMKACAIIALLFLSISGCGGGSGGSEGDAGPVSCSTALPGSPNGSVAVCVDLVGGTTEDVKRNRDQCTQQGNTFAQELCPKAGAVGGCRERLGSLAITTWYYAEGGATSSDIQTICAGLARVASGGVTIEFVSP